MLELNLEPLGYLCSIDNDDGYIVWRWGTGDNIELTHIRSIRKRGGSNLLKAMLMKLLDNPPHTTVFGFTRYDNHRAKAFYLRCGFSLTDVTGIYEEGIATMFSAEFSKLCILHEVHK